MDRPRQTHRFERWPRVAAGLAVVLGVITLLGWWLDLPVLRSGFGVGVAMNPVTAVAFLLAGVSLWPCVDGSSARWLRRLGLGCAVGVVAIAILKLGAQLFGWPLAIDRVLFESKLATAGGRFPGRMGINAAFSFLVLGCGVLLIRTTRDTLRLLGRSLALLSGIGGFLTLVAYLYRQIFLAGDPGQIPLALNTGLGFVALALGATVAGARVDREGVEAGDRHALRRKVNLALIVAVGILLITGGISVWSAFRSRIAAAERRASVSRSTELDRLLASVQGAEAAQRGYLLTPQPGLLIPYRAARDSLSVQLGRAAALFASDPARARRLASLDSMVQRRLAELSGSIELRQRGQTSAALELMRSESEQTLTRGIWEELAVLSTQEDSAVAAWNARLRTADRIALSTNFTAGLLAVFFLVLAGLTINRDLKKRIETEGELRESQRRLSQIVELIPGMVFLKDPTELRFVRVNRAGEELLGQARDVVLGKTVFDLFPKDEAESFNAEDRAVLASSEVLDIPEEVVHTRNKGRRLLHTK
ncbi:MAG TPA: CHASE3 domain-containing protein, partial [Gemmatimonadales bacterium]|nr:CHASE3 domain-containing protein [Gemmatimonadales bacterium]